jgi:hypothetical protein
MDARIITLSSRARAAVIMSSSFRAIRINKVSHNDMVQDDIHHSDEFEARPLPDGSGCRVAESQKKAAPVSPTIKNLESFRLQRAIARLLSFTAPPNTRYSPTSRRLEGCRTQGGLSWT